MSQATRLPTGTVTYVFTDIEGSTRLVQRLGDSFPDLLDDHHRLLRDAFSEFGAHEVSTEGDAFFVVFPTVSQAVDAVATAQRALAEHDWGAAGPVKVRMGLHTGEATLAGDNYTGIHVHRASRIAGAAHGGQVVLSSTTKALLQDCLPEWGSILDLGEHRLKDLENKERIFQLSISGLPDEFPPLRSIDNRPNNLPTQLTPFIARDREVRSLEQLLEEKRLVTLTGPGGTGKTRLSLEVAANCIGAFEDGVFFVPLAPVVDPTLVPSIIATQLGVTASGSQPIAATLKESLAEKQMLLVLDNFEQILPAASFVNDLLVAAPRVRSLVSSRAALKVSGEQEFPVPPMGLPDPEQVVGADDATYYEAVELFLQRARAIKPDFELTDENAPAIAAICARLDGLPLAIELAAARLRLLSPQDLLKRLESSIGVLSSGARDLPSRQQTLRGAIEWSYNLLDETHQTFFRRLAVFVGGCTFEAAETVCNPDSEIGVETLDCLSMLVEQSLIRQLETDDGQTRFRFLQTIREYALESLASSDEFEEIRRRHATYFLDLAERAQPHLTSTVEWVDRIEVEQDNFRAALRWTIEKSEMAMGLRTAAALWRAWHLRGHLEEASKWFAELLAAPDSEPHKHERAQALMGAGSITYWQNDFAAARKYYEEGLELFRAVGDDVGAAQASYNLGFLELIDGNPTEAKKLYEESREIYRRLDDTGNIGWTTWGLSMVALQERDLDTAEELGRHIIEVFKSVDNWYGVWTGQFVLYQAARYRGDFEHARALILESLPAVIEAQDDSSIASLMEMFGEIEIRLGRPRRGLRLSAAGSEVKRQLGGGAPPALVDIADPIELVRESLDKDEIEAAWNEGLLMSAAEGLAYMQKDPEPE